MFRQRRGSPRALYALYDKDPYVNRITEMLDALEAGANVDRGSQG